jgi:hypothetical protein
MFIGHFAAGFAAKRFAPGTGLGTLWIAAQLPDVLWPMFLLAGVEQVAIQPGNTAFTPLNFLYYPWTHSLLMSLVWGTALAVLWRVCNRGWDVSAVLLCLVMSHWVLDWVTHRPDLPLLPTSYSKYGLGLWNSVEATLAVEGTLLAFGIVVYARATQARDKIGSVGLWSVIVLLIAVYLGAAFGPPPPGVTTLAASALLIVMFLPIGNWIDRHRTYLRET